MSYFKIKNTVQAFAVRRTSHRAIRTISRLLLAGTVIFMTYSGASAREEAPRQKLPCSSAKAKNDQRTYNPMTGNFEPAAPFGTRSNN